VQISSSLTCRTAVQCHVGTVQQRYGATLAPYSYCMVPSLYRTEAVHWWLSQSIGTNQRRKIYSKVARRTVAVRGHHGTIRRLDRDTDDRKNLTRPVKADSIVVKTLWPVLCSSHDGVPLKWKNENGRPDRLKISIDWYHFRTLLPVVGQYLVPLIWWMFSAVRG